MTQPVSRPPAKRLASTSELPRTVGWLGGTALFGFLACQFPGVSPSGTATGPDSDSISLRPKPPAGIEASKDSVTLRPDPVPGSEPVFVRNGPYEGEACAAEVQARCTIDGALLRCVDGTLIPRWYFDYGCVKGDTVPKWQGMLGFNGIDASGRKAPRARRQARALA